MSDLTEEERIETLPQLRRSLKSLGYKVGTKTLSWGRHATFKHIGSGDELTYNVFNREQMERWKPLFEWRREHVEELRYIALNEDAPDKLYGLMPDGEKI